jgi:hypothetical protein
MSAQHTIINTIKNLFAPVPQERRYGHASFVVGEDGEYQHAATHFTERPFKGESEEAFVARVRREYNQPGDQVDVYCEAGRTVAARITRLPR